MTKFQTPEEQLAAMTSRVPVETRPAASLLLVRDGAQGLEVLMVVRTHEVDFAGGAMVFPGGKVSDGDSKLALGDRLLGNEGLEMAESALRVSALREGYEEVGILPALTPSGELARDADVACIDSVRSDVDRGRVSFADVLRQSDLRIDISAMVSFAHLVTPAIASKRFDTWFYLCAAPSGQTARPDGREIIEAHWLTPQRAMTRGEDGTNFIMFPTRLVLERLAQFTSVADVFAHAREVPPGLLLPTPEIRDGVLGLASPPVSGFVGTWESMADITKGKRLGYKRQLEQE
jgi:8-oxo-dGTP pyrophosphatase MutT (NUDIX family)